MNLFPRFSRSPNHTTRVTSLSKEGFKNKKKDDSSFLYHTLCALTRHRQTRETHTCGLRSTRRQTKRRMGEKRKETRFTNAVKTGTTKGR